jgi:uncharacterized protein with PIN domain
MGGLDDCLAALETLTMKTHLPICEHCSQPIPSNQEHRIVERHSGPSTHYLHFHLDCWRCPRCGTNGPHYCPADIARD